MLAVCSCKARSPIRVYLALLMQRKSYHQTVLSGLKVSQCI